MKAPRIAKAVGHIDDDLVSGANRAKVVKKNAWLKWGSIAACLTIMIMAAVIAVPMMFGGDDPISPIGSEGADQTGTDEEIQLEKYYDYQIKDGMFAPYIGGKVIEEGSVGSKLDNVTVTAGWKNNVGEWLSVENLNAEVYAIKFVESNVAVALKFIDQGEAITTTHYYTLTHPNAEYNGTVFPNYLANNPVRYLEETNMGKCNGWQDLGLGGEVRTITVPLGSTYVYQMYSYYIRNDLRHIYSDDELPYDLEDLAEWLSDTTTSGRKSFWYSMGLRIPESITLTATSVITSDNNNASFIKAEYTILLNDGASQKEESWVVYFLEEDNVYSAFAVVANEDFDFVKSYTDSIIKSFQKKQ